MRLFWVIFEQCAFFSDIGQLESWFSKIWLWQVLKALIIAHHQNSSSGFSTMMIIMTQQRYLHDTEKKAPDFTLLLQQISATPEAQIPALNGWWAIDLELKGLQIRDLEMKWHMWWMKIHWTISKPQKFGKILGLLLKIFGFLCDFSHFKRKNSNIWKKKSL